VVGGDTLLPSLAPVLTVTSGVNWTIPASFWGADVRVYYPLGSAQASAVNATPIQFVRWPGGAVADEYNYTANLVYSNGGSSYAPPSNESLFVAWCRTVGCHAILQLPAEIDSPATAASYVAYTVGTLHFRPAYWEIGNEPAQWSHFGTPWTHWSPAQNTNATPGTYASVVQSYVRAIRGVDPTAHIIGLPGVGTGGYNEDIWIQATVRLNGPNLSAVAIHVYPAGGSSTSPTLGAFFGTLDGSGSLLARIPRDRAAILSGCSTCTGIQLLVTELGTGTAGGPFSAIMAGFSSVPFIAAEIAQAIQLQVPNVDLFAFQSSYSSSLLNTTGVPTGMDRLYSQVFSQLQSRTLNFSLSRTVPDVYVVPTVNAARTTYTLLVVNANTSLPIRLSVAGLGFPLLNAGSDWLWSGGSFAPIVTSWLTGLGPTGFSLPPRTVLEIEVV
ncbi:MAG: hypothetical protein L3J91_05450, partial [Thermoplasmata archaeon]|nr:hypothetical protein [Thermoplasmata archaeon]